MTDPETSERHGLRTADLTLRWLLFALSGLLLVLFLYAAVRRMRYPFELEWIESGILVSILRIVHGQQIYVRPTLDFVPYLYAPLYLYLVAGVTRLSGIGLHDYTAMRLISTLSTLGSCIAIAALVRSETRRWLPCVAAAGLYVGCYSILDSFLDIGRVDSLFVFLLLVALLVQRRGHPILAALVWVLVFQTKQTVLPLAVLILLAEYQRPRRAISAVLTFLAVGGGSILVLNHLTHGWYAFYCFSVTRGLPWVARLLLLYWPQVVLEPLGIAWVLIGAAMLLTGVRLRTHKSMFYAFVSFALFAGVWFVEAHRGASRNAIMPVYAWTAVLFGVAVARLLDWTETVERASGTARWREAARSVILGAACLQLVVMIYNPGQYVASQAAVAGLNKTIGEIRSLPGDVYVRYHSSYAVMAGKRPQAEMEALGAVLDANTSETSRLNSEMQAAFATHRYTALVTDTPEAWMTPTPGYQLAISAPPVGTHWLTSQPQWFLFPCGTAKAVTDLVERTATLTNGDGCTGEKDTTK